jgi:hypothetical protein
MRTISRIALAVILAAGMISSGCTKKTPVTPPGTPPVNKDFLITATWTYNFTNFMQCSSTVTAGCINGFTWGYLNAAGAQVALKTSVPSVCTGSTQPQTCTDTANSQLPIGSDTFSIVVNYLDSTGKAQTTTAVTTASPTVIAAGLPAGFSITAQ